QQAATFSRIAFLSDSLTAWSASVEGGCSAVCSGGCGAGGCCGVRGAGFFSFSRFFSTEAKSASCGLFGFWAGLSGALGGFGLTDGVGSGSVCVTGGTGSGLGSGFGSGLGCGAGSGSGVGAGGGGVRTGCGGCGAGGAGSGALGGGGGGV